MGVYRRKRIWYIDYYVRGRRVRERVGPSKRLAETVLKKREVEIAENRFLDIRKQGKIRFGNGADRYLKTYSEPNKKSARRDSISIRHLKAQFGGQFLDQLTPEDIEAYKAKRKEKVSSATVNREIACLKHILTKLLNGEKSAEILL